MLHFIQVRFEEAAGTDDKVNLAVPSDLVFKTAKIVDVDGIAANSADYITVKVLGNDQTAVLAQWSTQDTAQGALTAGVSADLVDQGNADKALFSAGDMIEISVTNTGSTGKACNCMIVCQFELARAY